MSKLTRWNADDRFIHGCHNCHLNREKRVQSDEGMEQKSMEERVKTIIWAALISISVAAITWMILDSWHYANPDPKAMQIVDKYEAKGKCYIQTWIEVSPEEYIGLDIGDEYEEKK